MNNRLRELMIRAGYAAPEIAGRAHKLAELIVQECAYRARQCYTVRAVDAEDVAKHVEETFGEK